MLIVPPTPFLVNVSNGRESGSYVCSVKEGIVPQSGYWKLVTLSLLMPYCTELRCVRPTLSYLTALAQFLFASGARVRERIWRP